MSITAYRVVTCDHSTFMHCACDCIYISKIASSKKFQGVKTNGASPLSYMDIGSNG